MTKNASTLTGAATARDLIATPVAASTRGQPQFRWSQLLRLCKPRVVSLIVFTAVIGMFLAVPGLPPAGPLLFGSLGIALIAAAAAAVNCLIEREIDAKMARTRARPLPTGSATPLQTLILAAVLGGAGLVSLYLGANPLTMWLTLATFLGYAVIYTVVLKPLTPQNIVIGGLSGAMPPVLGWTAVTGAVSSNALLLLLIIFAWTPPHFWALALYRKHEYAKAGIPMLPVTHGDRFTRLHVLLYTVILAAVSLMPFASGMSGRFYLVSAIALDGAFLYFAFRLYTDFSTSLAARTFRYSIIYLSCLFAALLVDHYLPS
ncbi:MAG TPA: heme o synthase [Steroidobacteraceae bacterium]|nr:heme o synthase [Steroidobacteraceae bacterium]